MKEHAKLIGPLLSRLRATKPGATYPLDPVERELVLDEIARLKVVLKGIEVYSSSHDDARGMAAKALLADEQRSDQK